MTQDNPPAGEARPPEGTKSSDPARPPVLYRAFISYSHAADSSLAPALQSKLEQFAKPWYRVRNFRIFRDATNLSVAPALWPKIVEALGSSEFLLLMASPRAAQSEWVQKELTYWREQKEVNKLLIILTEGTLAWDEASHDFDWSRTTAVPAVLRGAFLEEPFYLDFSGFRASQLSLSDPKFLDQIATVAATLHGKNKDEIAGEHIRQHRRTMRLAWSAVIGLAILAATSTLAAIYAFHEQGVAETQTKVAETKTQEARREAKEARRQAGRMLSSRLNTTARARMTKEPHLAALLAVEAVRALRLDEFPEHRFLPALETLPEALNAVGGRRLGRGSGSVIVAPVFQQFVLTPDGRALAAGSADAVWVWDLTAPDPNLRPRALEKPGSGNLAISADGKTVASTSAYRHDRVWLWRFDSADPSPQPRDFGWPGGSVNDLAISPDGRWLGASCRDNMVRLWDLTAADPVRSCRVLPGHADRVESVVFSRNSGTLASASVDHTVRLWDLTAADPAATCRVLRGHGLGDAKVVFAPDGETLATYDTAVRLWDLTAADPAAGPRVIPGSDAVIDQVVFSPVAPVLAIVRRASPIQFWDFGSAGPPVLKNGDLPGRLIAFSADGKMAVAGDDALPWIYDVGAPDFKAFGVLGVLSGHQGLVTQLAFLPDGKRIVSSAVDGTVRLWDRGRDDPDLRPVVLKGHGDRVIQVGFVPGRRMIASVSADGTARLWDLAASGPGASARVIKREGNPALSAVVFPDGKRLAVGFQDGSIGLYEVDGPDSSARDLQGDGQAVVRVAVSRDGRALASASIGRPIRVWDLAATGPAARPRLLAGHAAPVYDLAFRPDGRALASASWEKFIRLWDLTSNEPMGRARLLKRFDEEHDPELGFTLTFSPDGKRLASSSEDREVRLWDLTAADPAARPVILKEPPGHLGRLKRIAFSPDGRRLASSTEGLGPNHVGVRVWDLASDGSTSRGLMGHQQEVLDFAFAPDGKSLASASQDATIRLWDLTAVTGPANARALAGHFGPVTSVAFSEDGRTLASGSADRTIRIWDLDPLELFVIAQRKLGRNLSLLEWRDHFPGEPYRPTFPELPAPTHGAPGQTPPAEFQLSLDEYRDQFDGIARNLTRREWARVFPDLPYRKTFPELPEPADEPTEVVP